MDSGYRKNEIPVALYVVFPPAYIGERPATIVFHDGEVAARGIFHSRKAAEEYIAKRDSQIPYTIHRFINSTSS